VTEVEPNLPGYNRYNPMLKVVRASFFILTKLTCSVQSSLARSAGRILQRGIVMDITALAVAVVLAISAVAKTARTKD
jgi:hypothetical protein